MKTPSTTFERLAGALLIATLGAAYWSLAKARKAGQNAGDDVVLEAQAERLAGVVPGSAVRLRGVDVGSVRAVKLGSPGDGARPVLITMAVQRDAVGWLHEDALARVVSPLVGAAAIELVEGVGAPRTAGRIMDVKLDASLADGIGNILQDVHGFDSKIATILANIEVVTEGMKVLSSDLQDTSKPIGALVRDEAMTKKLRGTLEDVRALAADLRVVGLAAASPSDGVPAMLATTLEVTKNVQTATVSLRDETPRILQGVVRIAGEMERLVKALQSSADLAPEAIASSIVVLGETERTLLAVQKNFLLRGHVEPKQGTSGVGTPRSPREERRP